MNMVTRKRRILRGKTCPECGGPLAEEIRPFTMDGTFFGSYLFWVCTRCGDVLTPMDTFHLLEKVAESLGSRSARSLRHGMESLKKVAPGVV